MNQPATIPLDGLVTRENFDEQGYLQANPDVARAVAQGILLSGRQHFDHFGFKENRRMAVTANAALVALRREKLARLAPHLDLAMPHAMRGDKYDFLSDALRAETAVIDTVNVSSNPYSLGVQDLIKRHANGLVLDCGAGSRPIYYGNVVNYEIADYASTDVIGVAEKLPFKDNSFDGVISMAVLEHVRDPFACAAEIVRVLKPGGQLACGVPFLQPVHGYPHHYYNMTGQGLRALFERSLVIDYHAVEEAAHPVWSLAWIVNSWANGLDEAAREQFLALRMSDLQQPTYRFLQQPWVKNLSEEKQWELASGTFLIAHKPEA